jgi:hypothetical protein
VTVAEIGRDRHRPGRDHGAGRAGRLPGEQDAGDKVRVAHPSSSEATMVAQQSAAARIGRQTLSRV